MQLFVAFLVVMFLIGGTGPGRVVRDRPLVLMMLSGLAAASFYSLSVVL